MPRLPRPRKTSRMDKQQATMEPPSAAILVARASLPYDFSSLTWDKNHQRNKEEKYCYCGQSGEWYKRMLQCCKCHQWFHQECLRHSVPNNMLFGDRFFHFTCALCTCKVEEKLTRLDMSWTECLHLVLFNLTVINRKKYHDVENSVIPFFKQKWKSLQGPANQLKPPRLNKEFLTGLLLRNKTRYLIAFNDIIKALIKVSMRHRVSTEWYILGPEESGPAFLAQQIRLLAAESLGKGGPERRPAEDASAKDG